MAASSAKLTKKSKSHEREIFNELEDFLRTLNFTKGSRFEAARRHKKRSRTTNLSIMILSLYVIIFTLIPYLNPNVLSDLSKAYLYISTITMSSAIIGFSLFESGKRHELRSELLLKSARAMSEIFSRVKYIKSLNKVDSDKLKEYISDYHKILGDFEDNHAHMDFLLYKTNIYNNHSDERVHLKERIKSLSLSNPTSKKLVKLKTRLKIITSKDRSMSIKRVRAKFQTFLHIYILFIISVLSPLIVFSIIRIVVLIFGLELFTNGNEI